MMNKFINKVALSGIILIMLSVGVAQAKDLSPLGKEITLKDQTNVSEMMKAPENYIGKKVLIKGKVLDVCTERGCWMKVSSDKKKESLIVKVNDGEMVFPVSARGKDVAVEGELIKIEMNKEEAHEMHMKDKSAEMKKPKTIYMFKPVGVKFDN